jgi:hypothetical protein
MALMAVARLPVSSTERLRLQEQSQSLQYQHSAPETTYDCGCLSTLYSVSHLLSESSFLLFPVGFCIGRCDCRLVNRDYSMDSSPHIVLHSHVVSFNIDRCLEEIDDNPTQMIFIDEPGLAWEGAARLPFDDDASEAS